MKTEGGFNYRDYVAELLKQGWLLPITATERAADESETIYDFHLEGDSDIPTCTTRKVDVRFGPKFPVKIHFSNIQGRKATVIIQGEAPPEPVQ